MRLGKFVGVLIMLVMLGSIVTPVMALKMSNTEIGIDKYETAKLALSLLMSNRKNAATIFENLPPNVKQDIIELLKVKTIVTRIENQINFPHYLYYQNLDQIALPLALKEKTFLE